MEGRFSKKQSRRDLWKQVICTLVQSKKQMMLKEMKVSCDTVFISLQWLR